MEFSLLPTAAFLPSPAWALLQGARQRSGLSSGRYLAGWHPPLPLPHPASRISSRIIPTPTLLRLFARLLSPLLLPSTAFARDRLLLRPPVACPTFARPSPRRGRRMPILLRHPPPPWPRRRARESAMVREFVPPSTVVAQQDTIPAQFYLPSVLIPRRSSRKRQILRWRPSPRRQWPRSRQRQRHSVSPLNANFPVLFQTQN